MNQNFNQLRDHSVLSAGKLIKYNNAKDKAVEAGLQFGKVYYNLSNLKFKLEGPLLDATKFIVNDLLDLFEWTFQEAGSIANFGDLEGKKEITYLETKLLHKIVTTVKGKGRENAKKFYAAMVGLSVPMQTIFDLENRQQILASESNKAETEYYKVCTGYGVNAESIDGIVNEKLIAEGFIPKEVFSDKETKEKSTKPAATKSQKKKVASK
jgi:hypothetical protein